MSRTVHVAAPSRLHFGLWSFGAITSAAGCAGRQFGGVGAMIERPGLRLEIAGAERFSARGPLAERATAFAHRWAEFHRLASPACELIVREAPPEHVGLGTGTQLALAVAAGLSAWCGLPAQSPLELAVSVGRGQRSAVGTYGFVHGGLIVEQGKVAGELVSPLDCRLDLPEDWRFVLVRPIELTGLSGDDEAQTIAALAEVPGPIHARLVAEVREDLVPAAATGDFTDFAASLYRYGNLAGQCFAARQGGPYNGPVLTALVERIRELGHAGVGQSSWGPTLFVVTQSQPAAEELSRRLAADVAFGALETIITPPCNAGARINLANQT
jgi:beta-ribofuranosylaminobenzene 5'-phosphate synthase